MCFAESPSHCVVANQYERSLLVPAGAGEIIRHPLLLHCPAATEDGKDPGLALLAGGPVGGVIGAVGIGKDLWSAYRKRRERKQLEAQGVAPNADALPSPVDQRPEDLIAQGGQPVYAAPEGSLAPSNTRPPIQSALPPNQPAAVADRRTFPLLELGTVLQGEISASTGTQGCRFEAKAGQGVDLKFERLAGERHRSEFYGVASTLIRRILVDHARKRQAARRGQAVPMVSFEEALGVPIPEDSSIVDLDEALERLARSIHEEQRWSSCMPSAGSASRKSRRPSRSDGLRRCVIGTMPSSGCGGT